MPRTRTIGELETELRVKQKALRRLQSRRAELAAELAAMDRQIAALVGRTGGGRVKAAGDGRRRRRRAGGKPLVSYIESVLKKAGQALRAKEITQAVRQAGYRTGSKNFYGIVAAALRDGKLFRRVRRGMYTLK